MNRTRHLFRSSLIVIVFFALGKLSGLIRTQFVGRAFGTGPAFDAFTAANQLPEVFVTLIAGGALAAAFIPVYSAHLTRQQDKEAAQLANATLTLVLLLLGGISALGIFFAPYLTRTYLVPEYTPAQQALTASLMRIILVQTTLFGVSGVLSSLLNAHQHFALPALAPMALDIGYLVGVFFFVPRLGIHGLAWGTVVGGVLHIAIQLPALLRYKFRYFPMLGFRLPGLREIVRLMGPRIVTLGAVQIADLFIVSIMSGMPAGSTSGYFYGYYLQQLPETLLGTAIAIVVFPTMAELFNAGNIEALKRTAISALSIIWTLTIPAAAALVLLGEPAITVLLQRGAFDAASTRLVYSILIYFSVRVVSEASLEILARLFYARHNTFIPMFVALGWLAVSAALFKLLVGPLGVAGLALASTIAFTLQSITLYLLNRWQLGNLYERELLISGGRALLATGGMAVVILFIKQFVASPLLLLLAGGSAGIITYAAINLLTGGQELFTLWRLTRNRI